MRPTYCCIEKLISQREGGITSVLEGDIIVADRQTDTHEFKGNVDLIRYSVIETEHGAGGQWIAEDD